MISSLPESISLKEKNSSTVMFRVSAATTGFTSRASTWRNRTSMSALVLPTEST